MQVKLRCATEDDAPAVAEVIISSRKAFLPYAPMAHSPSEVVQWVQYTLIPSHNVTVATVSEAIAGVLATSISEGTSWIDQLYVLPGHVGQGIGSRLLELALASLARPIRLYTFQANAGARRFYERHGFRAIKFTDGSANEERCPDVLLELVAGSENAA
ncbi:GNAT family N-acetyltransferase [Piscinibacter sp. HJYY11]|uniref:GNAT family N-acetyltransferase n=1 Tax=Piscinibacter sp. HJYY11 TaxID=2801333 RepID=UPI00191CC64F|nr:GNAT family N-acetyltransferase [Piscinibacter sp. HJYY11]MBL0726273.1 GNAT family N-acetyltransferase [Piscinibacter sp. HJYY11]